MKNQKKDAYWFPHYSNTRDEPLIALMRMKLGAEGYGVYIMILEMMRDAEGYELKASYEVIAWVLNLQNYELVKKVIEDFGLFELENDSTLVSKRLNKLMSGYDRAIIDSQINGFKSALVKHRDYTKTDLKSFTNEEIQTIYEEEFSENHSKDRTNSKGFEKALKDTLNKESTRDQMIGNEKKVNFNKKDDDLDFQFLDSYTKKLGSDQSKIYEFINDSRNDLTSETFQLKLEGFSKTLKEKETKLNSYNQFVELFLNYQNCNNGIKKSNQY